MMWRSMVEKHQDTVDTKLKTGNDREDERKQIYMLAVLASLERLSGSENSKVEVTVPNRMEAIVTPSVGETYELRVRKEALPVDSNWCPMDN